MGPCHPTLKLGVTPNAGALRQRIPDVSEYQPCVTGRVPTVIRLYEAGTDRQDAQAACNARRLRAGHLWFAGYSFLRPGSCTQEADRTVAIVRGIGGLNGPVVADAEVPLPAGFVRCFLGRVHHDAPSSPTGTYTSCGTVSEVVLPLWVANYGVQWPCTPFGDPFEAWQFSAGSYCGERFVTDCSLDFGITRLRPAHRKPPPKPRPPAEKRRLIRYWTVERAAVLHRYRLYCRGSSTGPKCTAWRRLEHILYLDIRRES
jgi:hypothetical protein